MSTELQEIRDLIANLDHRLRTIEASGRAAPQSQPVAAAPPVVARPASTAQVSTPARSATPAYKPVAPVPVGGKLGTPFAIISFVCFLLAAVYIIRLVWEAGWLTPERQIFLAAALGISLIALGIKLKDTDFDYSPGLAATGAVILNLAIFAGHLYYDLIPLSVAIAGVGAVSIFTIYLFSIFNSMIFIVCSVLSTYAIPFLLYKAGLNLVSVASYHTVWALLFSFLATKFDRREIHAFASFVGLLVFAVIALSGNTFSYMFLKTTPFDPEAALLSTFVLFQGLQFGIFALGTILHTVYSDKALTEKEANYYLLPLLLFYATEYSALHHLVPDLAAWISLGFAAFLIGIYKIGSKAMEASRLESLGIVQVFSAYVFFHAFYINICPDELKPWLLIVILFSCAIPALQSAAGEMFARLPIVFLMLFFFANEFFRLLSHNFSSHQVGHLSLASIVLVVLMMGIYVSPFLKRLPSLFQMLPIFAHLQAMAALYNLLRDVGTLGVTVAWGVYAAAILGLAFRQKNRNLGKSSVLVLGAAAAKALFYDIGISGGTSTVFVLLATGATLYGGALLLNQIDKMKAAN